MVYFDFTCYLCVHLAFCILLSAFCIVYSLLFLRLFAIGRFFVFIDPLEDLAFGHGAVQMHHFSIFHYSFVLSRRDFSQSRSFFLFARNLSLHF